MNKEKDGKSEHDEMGDTKISLKNHSWKVKSSKRRCYETYSKYIARKDQKRVANLELEIRNLADKLDSVVQILSKEYQGL